MTEENDNSHSSSGAEPVTTRRGIRSFVLRQGRMTEGQKKAYERNWPKFGLTREHGMIDPREIFGREAVLNLEIGFGMGQSLAAMAEAAPEQDFIGVEVHTAGVGALLKEVEDRGLENVRVYNIDANDVIDLCLPDAGLDCVMLFFPDPWHKKRHHKRRLVQPEFVQRIRHKLRVGGIFHLATDWENYAEHMMEVLSASEGFANTQPEGSYSPRPEQRPQTKFERRGLDRGHGVWDLLFRRTN
ncbi:MAG: tRNA (guanosine(46)-N7)-methyltransferase TrmB [Alteromonadaceae bacterium]|uniref:tRNA (guanosine(46)-N7)-methyltransferase TrmB n=1 Tax=Marinobacter sp. BGYM27 TaxID=2975597 RepID=UPI000C356D5A|nr:tRNA (guanosine(46)-N7)-methyltransferase TrmB [Marinobacter sp. BGYM27]MAA66430.1 tRNA (guanosine(46)-N7)-methyltransferase TrmB [Alteromonadaceae bacterium]MBH85287.1 tRNA (guanosine(46)-N7)-methyltransferase TrmB [Alteromonadaceae bacterium]MDG5499834.1 tRNA (guanosine(46)-N7)-methyltransferase TrmB [Marinobacter sp. BGYM27]|tara:strand:- start:53446 stop:54174 length:729 start_codon:yes stop_codon:yes gene_type:complete